MVAPEKSASERHMNAAAADVPVDPPTGLLGDTPLRDYSVKLRAFNAFAAPELRSLIAGLGLQPGMRILDVGCGTGEAMNWLSHEIAPSGTVIGIELSSAHADAARRRLLPQNRLIHGDLLNTKFDRDSFDLIWCVNTINHLHHPVADVARLAGYLRRNGRIAVGQSALLADMVFAWDSRLERVTHEANRRYYRERYGLSEYDLTAVRAVVGTLRRAQLRNVVSRTVMIERVSELNEAAETYLREVILHDMRAERLRPYLSDRDAGELGRLCDPSHIEYAPRRPDFHFLQTFTLAIGEL
jgi:SAM-dependent methyltransferase